MYAYCVGLSMKSILLTSLIPMAFRFRITPLKLHLNISGTVFSSSYLKLSSLYSLKHLPGASLPARPALCVDEFFEIASTLSVSMPVEFL
jgi:hypothetical protein